jgi:hypothetical protein
MLHLCGYDDRTDAAFAAMHRTEDRILSQLGVGPVFAPTTSAAPDAARPRPRRRQSRRTAPRATGAH